MRDRADDGANRAGRSDRTVLVTGAAGFIGSHLCEALVETGRSVWGLDNFHPHYSPDLKRRNLEAVLAHPAMHLVQGDARDSVLLEGLLSGRRFDAVVHLAALPGVQVSVEAPDRCIDINVNGTLTVLEAAARHGVGSVAFASSSSVYGESTRRPFRESGPADRPISPYAASKRAGEMLCHAYHRTYGLSVHCLRIFTAFGPRQRPDLAIHKFTRLMRDGHTVTLFGDGSSERDYTHVDDVVSGVLASLDRLASLEGEPEYEVINLGRGRSVRLDRLVEALAAGLDVEPDLEWLPDRPGDVPVTHASVEKAKRLLDWEPRRSLEEGLEAFVRWFDEHRAADRTRPREGTGGRSAQWLDARTPETDPASVRAVPDPTAAGGAG